MDALVKRPKSGAIIRFQDCDPYGQLYNARYIDYFMNAREDQLLDNYGLDVYAVGATEQVCWVVAQNQIAYLQPSVLMEKVWITSRLIKYSPKGITVEFLMYNREETRIKALMWTNFVHFNLRERKSEVHAEKYMELFEQAHDPVEESTFDERLKSLRSSATL